MFNEHRPLLRHPLVRVQHHVGARLGDRHLQVVEGTVRDVHGLRDAREHLTNQRERPGDGRKLDGHDGLLAQPLPRG